MIQIKEDDERFRLDKSTIEDAGVGVFANKFINKGEKLNVKGIIVEKNSTADICTHYANDYKFEFYDCNKYLIPTGFAGIVNHTDDQEKQNVEIRRIEKESLFYEFIKDVKQGEEILGNYGENWSKIFKEKKDWQMFLNLDLYNLKEIK